MTVIKVVGQQRWWWCWWWYFRTSTHIWRKHTTHKITSPSFYAIISISTTIALLVEATHHHPSLSCPQRPWLHTHWPRPDCSGARQIIDRINFDTVIDVYLHACKWVSPNNLAIICICMTRKFSNLGRQQLNIWSSSGQTISKIDSSNTTILSAAFVEWAKLHLARYVKQTPSSFRKPTTHISHREAGAQKFGSQSAQ